MRPAATMVLLVMTACGADDAPATCDEASWRAVTPELDRSVLAAWGGGGEVWFAGGDLGVGGTGPLAGRWDGTRFEELDTGQPNSLWWVWGAPDGSAIWMVGERGTVLRRVGDRFEVVPSGTEATLFGVWGSSADDVWIVGGTPGPDEPDKDLVLHWDGATLAREPLPAPRGTALLKVWGSGPADVWVTGEGGTLWHRGATGWTDRSAEIGTAYSLFSVHGCGADDVWVTGGRSIARWDGANWQAVPEAEALVGGSATGVACGPTAVAVVGAGGLKLRFDKASATWSDETLAEPWGADFHGTWVSAEGDIWAVGGNYTSPATSIDRRTGVIAYRGCAAPTW